MKSLNFSLFFLLLGSFLLPLGISAQMNIVPQDDVNVTMIPENPGPNQSVEVTIQSFSTNINAATITWKVNGTVKSTGIGLRTFTFTTGSMDTTTTLGITVETSDGETISQTVKVKPASVDLLWQSDSFTPPFYKGKALFSYQNKITFIALPHLTGSNGVEIGAKNLIYTWSLNGSVVEDVSGFGKNTYTLIGSIIARPLDVSVEARSPSSDGVAMAETVVSPITPSVILYEKNPLYGIRFQRALAGRVAMADSKEMTVIAAPFFFGTPYISSPDLAYTWSVNGNVIPDDGHQTTQIFRQPEGASGTSSISLSIENASKVLQSAKGEFSLAF